VSPRLIYASLSLVVAMWGGAFVAIKILLRHASVWTMAQLRFTLTVLGLLAIVEL
jgi:hypothetical protein